MMQVSYFGSENQKKKWKKWNIDGLERFDDIIMKNEKKIYKASFEYATEVGLKAHQIHPRLQIKDTLVKPRFKMKRKD